MLSIITQIGGEVCMVYRIVPGRIGCNTPWTRFATRILHINTFQLFTPKSIGARASQPRQHFKKIAARSPSSRTPPRLMLRQLFFASSSTRYSSTLLHQGAPRSRFVSTWLPTSKADAMKMQRYNLLIDLNGTCHVGDTPTPGAVEAVSKLRRLQQQVPGRVNLRFCSNTSKESSSSLLSRLRRVGLGADLVSSEDVFTSLDAARRLVSRRHLRPLLLLSPSAQSAFREDQQLAEACFFARAEIEPDSLNTNDKDRLRRCNAVLIGLCPELMTQKWLDEAFRLVSGEYGGSEPVSLIATHRGRFRRCPRCWCSGSFHC